MNVLGRKRERVHEVDFKKERVRKNERGIHIDGEKEEERTQEKGNESD